MDESTLLEKISSFFKIDGDKEAVDVYFRNTYGITSTPYCDGSIRINGIMFENGKSTLEEVLAYLNQFPNTVYKITDASLEIEDAVCEIQKIVENLQARYQWAHLDDVHEMLKTNVQNIRNGADSIKRLAGMLSLDIKEEKVRLPHYTEHPEYNQ
jgi:hypothetical protein